ncbi:MAG: hypothetical protein AAB515_02790 [Patescibacteria group bacterium]
MSPRTVDEDRHPMTTSELITMARDPKRAVEDVVEAFLHYIPGSDDGYDELLSVLALEHPEVFLDMGVSPEHLKRTQDVLRVIRERFSLVKAL